MSRIFLNERDVRSPEAAARAAHEAILEWRVTEIRNALGQRFRAGVRVELHRPWWMPAFLYEILMRSIVIEGTAERVK